MGGTTPGQEVREHEEGSVAREARTSVEAHRALASLTVTRAEFHSGPLPEAAELQRYDAVLPGAADRIVTMAEKEQDFRHDGFRREQAVESLLTLLGQVFGIVIALAFGWWSYRLVGAGHEVAGSLIGVVDLVALVSLFLRRDPG